MTEFKTDGVIIKSISSICKMSIGSMEATPHGGLLCGCYEYVEKNKKRNGCAYILRFDEEKRELEISHHESVNGGVMDIKPFSCCMASVVTGDGRVGILQNGSSTFVQETYFAIPKTIISNPGFDANKRPLLQHVWMRDDIFTTSIEGSLYKLNRVQDCDMKLVQTVDEIHKYSPWAVCAMTNKSLIVTGGDDKMIKVHSGQDLSMVASVPSAHENGCCSLMEVTDDLFCSGGFEGEIHVWDIRKITGKTEGMVSTLKTHITGAWKMSLNGETSKSLLVSHIHDGFNLYNADFIYKSGVVECQPPYKCIWDYKKYSSHKDPLCYASCFIHRHFQSTLIGSATFYDRQLCIWTDNG
ncbi:hypothetical protein ACOME3_000161 [Neoechinorhynchus agilis]